MKHTLLILALALVPFARQDTGGAPAKAGPEVGAPAPSLRLNDHTGSLVAIGGEQERWTVLAFYPKALTPG